MGTTGGANESLDSWLPNSLRQRNDKKPTDTSSDSETDPNETTTLLPKPVNDDDPIEGECYEVEDEHQTRVQRISTELWILLKSSVPVILAYTLQNSLQTFSVLIVGRLSPEALSVAAFCYMFAMATAWLIGMGGTTAIDTIASASFTGSKDKHDLGIILQRAFVVLTILYIPIVILWIFSGPVFKALGQKEHIVRDGSKFLMVLIPGGLGYIYFECMKKFLQAQEIMRPGTYVLLVTSPINAGLNYLFVYTFDIGLLGAALATSISYWLSFFLLLAYARFIAGWECWGGFDRRCFQNIATFARIALFGIIHVGTEWWAFEIVAIVAGQLGTISLASQSVIMTADQVMHVYSWVEPSLCPRHLLTLYSNRYTIPFGQSVATSARIGNLLGARDAKGASRAANTAAWLSMMFGAVVLTILMATKENFARLFNNNEDVVRLTAEVLPFVALFQVADGLNGSCGGALRGMGRQHIGALVNIASYYCGALPLGIWLAFNGWGLAGLWFGQCLALYLVGFVEWTIVAFSNWDKEVENALQRLDPSERAENGEIANDGDWEESSTNGNAQ